MPRICVKWQTKKLEVDVNTDLEPMILKCQLFDLTGVAPERQKVIIKGNLLKDDDWGNVTLEDGLVCMMLGAASVSTEGQSCAAAAASMAMDTSSGSAEDIADASKNQVFLPCGLKNLGNTCYMNACLQSYKAIPQLNEALKKFSDVPSNDAKNRAKHLTGSVKQLFEDMDKVQNSDNQHCLVPFLMLNALHTAFPQFAARDEENKLQQHDANECFTETLSIVAGQVEIPSTSTNAQVNSGGTEKMIKASRLFDIGLEVTVKCTEGDEPVETSHEDLLQLSCFITEGVKHLQAGIQNKLTEEIEKNSMALNKNAKYQKQSLISRLPSYLCIQMVRFFYKDSKKVSAKILKDVKFPINLDVLDFCSSDLKDRLKAMRELIKAHSDKCEEELKLAKMDVDAPKINKSTKKEECELEPSHFADDAGSNNSGMYELKAVITHQGRSANSGHYVAWIHLEGSKWAKCDDDEITSVTEEDVLKLSGGGDWHSAYVLIYGSKSCPKTITKSA